MRNRRRNSVALFSTLCGAAIIVGAFLGWVDARGTRPASGIRHTSIIGLFHWSYQSSSFLRSFGIVLIVAGALVVIGGLAASRFMAAFFSLIALAVAGLWVALNASHYNPTDLRYSDLRIGAWLALGGSLIGLISSFFLRSGSRVRASTYQ